MPIHRTGRTRSRGPAAYGSYVDVGSMPRVQRSPMFTGRSRPSDQNRHWSARRPLHPLDPRLRGLQRRMRTLHALPMVSHGMRPPDARPERASPLTVVRLDVDGQPDAQGRQVAALHWGHAGANALGDPGLELVLG